MCYQKIKKLPHFHHWLITFAVVLCSLVVAAQEDSEKFTWPDGKRGAISLSFDDGWPSQIDIGLPLLDKYNVQATFYVVPARINKRLGGWKQAVAKGHEIGNHTLHHPCTENFDWVNSKNAIENYTLEKIRMELFEANRQIENLIGVTPESFAYPCGATSVGRGLKSKSFIPVVAKIFVSGRDWLGEVSNNPAKVDIAQVLGIKMDDKDFEGIHDILEEAKKEGRWLVLVGHEIGSKGAYTTRTAMLEKLLAYIQNPKNQLWVAPVGTVAKYITEKRGRKE
jgi:peptidoglycan/xylan/chitin deacetylase (PgdA/CDA1 family)